MNQRKAAHGTWQCYRLGCRRPECTAANTRQVQAERQRRRAARVELEQRLAARLRAALYHAEPWLQTPQGMTPAAWRNEIDRTIKRLERGNPLMKRTLAERAA